MMQFSRQWVAILGLLAGPAMAWDAAGDFDLQSSANPNGVWSYGYDPAALPGYQLKLFDALDTGPVLAWRDGSYQSLGTPSFAKNLTGGTINGGWGADQVMLHPGPTANGDAAILRFTAPTTGRYDVQSQFFVGDQGAVDVWIVLNGSFDAPLAALGDSAADPQWNAAGLALAAGDTLDFVVGNAGNFFYDTTPLAVSIVSSVPEPAPALLWACGAALLACRVRRQGLAQAPGRRRRAKARPASASGTIASVDGSGTEPKTAVPKSGSVPPLTI